MPGTWLGLNTALSSLAASQLALDTAAHNTANANTDGYSRQRVTLVESPPFTYPAFNRSGIPGQLGTGVTVATIERVRDSFLDLQIRSQLALQGQWQTTSDELAKVEAAFPEPNGSGLGTALNSFWNAWQDLAADPTSTAARSVLIGQAGTLAQQFKTAVGQVQNVIDGADYQVGQQVTQVNTLASQIASLNAQIQRVTVSGDHANDLADQRDLLLDQLGQIVPLTTVPKADGTVTVLIAGTDLVEHDKARTITLTLDPSHHGVPTWSNGGNVALGSSQLGSLVSLRDTTLVGYQGQLNQLAKGVADAVNVLQNPTPPGTGTDFFTYTPGLEASTIAVNPLVVATPSLVVAGAVGSPGDGGIAGAIADLRNASFRVVGGTLAANLVPGDVLATGGKATVTSLLVPGATAQGYTFTSTAPGTLTLTGADLSTQTITVAAMAAGSTQVLNFSQLGISITLQAPSTNAATKTAADLVTDLTLAANSTISVVAGTQTASGLYASLVGTIGSEAKQANEMSTNAGLVVSQLETRRQSVSGVSLDEEATDMIRFQRAYQAAARVITIVDETLDTLINKTGLVGR